MGASSYIPTYIPETYVVIGLADIAAMFGVTTRTIRNWRQKEGFPIARLPSGVWCLSLGLLDVWLAERNRIDPYAGGEVPMNFKRQETQVLAKARKVAASLGRDELQMILVEAVE